jgi:hypothetical protein
MPIPSESESDYHFNHNMFKVAYNIVEELQNHRKSLGKASIEMDENSFTNPSTSLVAAIRPFVLQRNLPQDPNTIPLETQLVQNTVSAETIKLLSEEFASSVAYAKDPSLKNPVPATKRSSK